jgi:hypothetical protein
MKYINKITIVVLIFLTILSNTQANDEKFTQNNTDSYFNEQNSIQELQFSNSLINKYSRSRLIVLKYHRNYAYYIFVGTPRKISALVHSNSLKGNSPVRVSYYGIGLYTDITDRMWSNGFLHSFIVNNSLVSRVFGVM